MVFLWLESQPTWPNHSRFFVEPGDIVMDSFGLSDAKSHSLESPRPIGIEAPDVNTEGLQGVWRAH
jgi:hypothetical protein